MKKSALFAMAILLALTLALRPVPALADKSYYAERFDVRLEPQAGGGMLVTETITFRFVGGPFTYAFRNVAATETDGLTFVQASMDGQALPLGDQAGQVEVFGFDPLEVTWHFAPTSDETHTFAVTYRVDGVIRQYADGDTLIWRAIPEEHEYNIQAGEITLIYPAGLSPIEQPTLDDPGAQAQPGASEMRWQLGALRENQSLIVTARFASGALVQAPPYWQAQAEDSRRQLAEGLPFGMGAGFLTMLGGLAGLGWFWRRNRRENEMPPGEMRLTAPPRDIPPAQAIALAGAGNAGMATLFDLARRGWLRFDEMKGVLGLGRTYVVTRLAGEGELGAHEQMLFDALFVTRRGERESLGLSEAGQIIGALASQFNKELESELRQAGWLDADRKAQRSRLLVFATLGIVLGAGLFLLGVTGRPTLPVMLLAGIGAGAVVSGIIAAIAGSAFSPLSTAGALEAEKWKSFLKYLRDITRGREPAQRPDTFERYLPFASAVGIGKAWARFFDRQGDVPLPAWLRTLSGGMDGGDFGAMVAFMSASDSSASSGSSDGGGGSSGGGSSGAG